MRHSYTHNVSLNLDPKEATYSSKMTRNPALFAASVSANTIEIKTK